MNVSFVPTSYVAKKLEDGHLFLHDLLCSPTFKQSMTSLTPVCTLQFQCLSDLPDAEGVQFVSSSSHQTFSEGMDI